MLEHPDEFRIVMLRVLPDGTYATVGRDQSVLSFYDHAGANTSDYTALWFQGKTRFEHDWIDGHEVIAITEGKWTGAVAIMTETPGESGDAQGVVGGGFIVFDPETETVLYDWSSHGEMGDGEPIDDKLSYSRRGMQNKDSWHHVNALLHGVDDNGDDYFWLNLRNQDWTLKVDPETDAVVWRLGYDGDFELIDDLDADSPTPLPAQDWMFQFHAPEWQSRNGSRTTVMYFDNGSVRATDDGSELAGAPYSRIIELEIDESTMKATLNYTYGDSSSSGEQHFYATHAGDVDMMADKSSFFMVTRENNKSDVTEVSYPDGEVIWQLSCNDTSYRGDYFPDLYQRTWWYDIDR